MLGRPTRTKATVGRMCLRNRKRASVGDVQFVKEGWRKRRSRRQRSGWGLGEVKAEAVFCSGFKGGRMAGPDFLMPMKCLG